MSDYTVNGALHHVKRVPKVEFTVYFGLILLLAIGPHVIGWTYQTIRRGKLPRLNPAVRAWKDAQAVTPMIFRG